MSWSIFSKGKHAVTFNRHQSFRRDISLLCSSSIKVLLFFPRKEDQEERQGDAWDGRRDQSDWHLNSDPKDVMKEEEIPCLVQQVPSDDPIPSFSTHFYFFFSCCIQEIKRHKFLLQVFSRSSFHVCHPFSFCWWWWFSTSSFWLLMWVSCWWRGPEVVFVIKVTWNENLVISILSGSQERNTSW